MASHPGNGLARQEHEQHLNHQFQSESQDSQSVAEPGVGQLVSQIQHIIKDSAGSQSGRAQGSGYSSPQEHTSLVSSPPPAQEAPSTQHNYRQAQQEHSAARLEDGMSEISISEPASETSKGSVMPSLKPRLSAPRRSLQPPTSPFAKDGTSLEDEAPAANGQLDKAAVEAQARTDSML